ncbi:MAG: glycosyltransferase [Lachnospiraceae bacterium]
MISLVLTTYNGEKYILEQLDSIRDQSMAPDEVLIYDDRSSDYTYHMVQEYISKNGLDNWHVFLNQENKGYSLNFSEGMKVLKGDIVFLADQDDIWLPNKISDMYKIMVDNPQISLLASNVVPFYTGDAPEKVNFEKFDSKKELIKIECMGKWIKPCRPGCSMCFRRNLLEDYGKVWFLKYPHDCLLWGLAVLRDEAYIYNRDTMKFRRHNTNASSRNGHSKDIRINILANEIKILRRMLTFQKEMENEEIVSYLEKQLAVFQRREKALDNHNVFAIIYLLPSIRYFGRNRFWFTDLYYCIKK